MINVRWNSRVAPRCCNEPVQTASTLTAVALPPGGTVRVSEVHRYTRRRCVSWDCSFCSSRYHVIIHPRSFTVASAQDARIFPVAAFLGAHDRTRKTRPKAVSLFTFKHQHCLRPPFPASTASAGTLHCPRRGRETGVADTSAGKQLLRRRS